MSRPDRVRHRLDDERRAMAESYMPLAKAFVRDNYERYIGIRDELLSCAYHGLCGAAANWRPERGVFKFYALKWMRNKARNAMRSRCRFLPPAEHRVFASCMEVLPARDEREPRDVAAEISPFLERLSPGLKVVVVGRLFERRTEAELAASLHLTQQAVHSRFVTASRQLREMIRLHERQLEHRKDYGEGLRILEAAGRGGSEAA